MGPNSLADIKGLGSIKAALKIGNKKMKDDLDKASLHSSITYWMALAAAVNKDNGVIVNSCVLSFPMQNPTGFST